MGPMSVLSVLIKQRDYYNSALKEDRRGRVLLTPGPSRSASVRLIHAGLGTSLRQPWKSDHLLTLVMDYYYFFILN